MLEFDAHKFVALLTMLRAVALLNKKATPQERAGIKGDPIMAQLLEDYAVLLGEMRLPASRNALAELILSVKMFDMRSDAADQSAGMVCKVLQHELKGRKFLQVDDYDLFGEGSELFGTEVATKFASSAAYEIDEAGKCLALERGTASVFHLMRVMEIGLRAVNACLGIPDPVKGFEKNWGSMLRKIKSEMDARNAEKPPRWLTPSDRVFFEEVYVSLDAVRNVWRNATMHVENKYTQDEAKHIFAAVRGFMRKLASRCDENGLPLA